MIEKLHEKETGESPPPIGGTWARLYAIVLGELALLVVLFRWFTEIFR